MKITKLEPVEYEAAILRVDAGVRYWEDGTINGREDNSEFPNMPFSASGRWNIEIDIDSGQILGWPKGTVAFVHYKVCDDGIYEIVDSTGAIICRLDDDYVPNILCPQDKGYGDYIIMEIDEEGYIHNWDKELIQQMMGNEKL